MKQPNKILTKNQLLGILILTSILVTIKIFTTLIPQKQILQPPQPTNLSQINLPANNTATLAIDPNTADSATLAQLNLSPSQIHNIINYRSKGGVFYHTADLIKLYSFNQTTLTTIQQHIHIDTTKLPTKKHHNYNNYLKQDSIHYNHLYQQFKSKHDSIKLAFQHKLDSLNKFNTITKKDTTLDLNATDSASLTLIKGIGPNTAHRIIQYRYQLHGYTSPNQIKELNLKTNTPLDSIIAHLTANPDSIHPININTASIATLQQHPYISFNLAKNIYNLRRKKIKIRSLSDLSTIPELNDSLLTILKPYLSLSN